LLIVSPSPVPPYFRVVCKKAAGGPGRGRVNSGTQAHYPAVEDEETGYPASRQVMAKHRHFADAMHSGG
jgi:hypothetical protein